MLDGCGMGGVLLYSECGGGGGGTAPCGDAKAGKGAEPMGTLGE